MRQLIEDLISAMEYHVEQTRPIHSTKVALQAAREALKSLPAQPEQRPWVGLTKEDMSSGEDPMFDHLYFIAGMVYADKVLMEKNT